jgi:integrase/recombinase XerD
VREFSAFTGRHQPAELRTITRAHVIAWRKYLESRELAPSSIRRKLSALSALFDYLCERNAVAGNPVDGVKRPMSNNNEGSTPALGDAQARKLLDAPPGDTLKGVRDRAILATLVYCRRNLQRREELGAPTEATWAERGRRAAGCGAPKCPEQSPDGRGSRRAAASSD